MIVSLVKNGDRSFILKASSWRLSCYSAGFCHTFFSKIPQNVGALFFAFNPISIFFLSISSSIYAYLSLPLIIVGTYEFLRQKPLGKKALALLLYTLGLSFLLVYTRVTGIYAIVLFALGLFYVKPLFKALWSQKLKAVTLFFASLAILAPLFVAYILPKVDGEARYFQGASNYVSDSAQYAKDVHYVNQHEPVSQLLSLSEITDNIMASWQNTQLFRYASAIVFIAIGALAVYYAVRRKNKLVLFVSALYLITLAIRSMGKFTGEGVFKVVMYKLLPFIANQPRWINVATVPLFAFMIAYVASRRLGKKVAIPLLGVFAVVMLIPFVTFHSNPRMATVNPQQMPAQYKNEFYSGSERRLPSVNYLDNGFAWSPYNLYPFWDRNQSVMSSGIRVVNARQVQVAQDVSIGRATTPKLANNARIFNLKKIYLYEDAKSYGRDISVWGRQYDVQAGLKAGNKLLNAPGAFEKEDISGNLRRYSLKNDENYEFNIYSPGAVNEVKSSNFYKKKLDVNTRPIVVDDKAYALQSSAKKLNDIAKGNANVKVEYKQSFYDQTRYYVKFSNFNKSKPFLLQLNKVYNPTWKLKLISKADYDKVACHDAQNYPISNNATCEFDGTPLALKDRLDSLGQKDATTAHFEGNYIGNTWVVDPSKAKEASGELYAIVTYDKQTAMSLSFLVSWGVIGTSAAIALGYAGKKYFPRAKKVLKIK